MKVKCFACALVAGMALSAVAAADPGIQKQASGGALPMVGHIMPVSKNMIPGHARYHYATRTWTILSQPGTVESGEPVVRGPVFNLIWDSSGPWAFEDYIADSTAFGFNEMLDGGVLCGDPGVTLHTINQFTFRYQTGDPAVPGSGTLDDPSLAVDIGLYWDFPACTAGPNGGIADANVAGGCPNTNNVIFTIGGLPGSPDGNAAAWVIDVDLTGGNEVQMHAGPFGYSYGNWVGFASPTGPTLTLNDQIAAPGAENGINAYTDSPQVGLLGNLWFGAANWAQYFFQVYSGDSVCGPVTSGACCLVDQSCTVTDQAGCDAQGGTFTLATPCSTFFCLPAPANDDCLTAEVISGFNTFAYDNRAATGVGPDPVAGCAAAPIPIGEDVWFSWQAPCSGGVTLTTCLLNLTDDAFAVYQGSNCGDLNTQVACDDDGCGTVGGQSTVSFSVTAGTNYLFRMGTWNSTAGGENFFTLTNDSCTGGPAFCDADWCQDGSVGVPDIFCFLSDWFALVPEARNFGGSPGVPAIFAFLSEWFSTGQGPCTP